MKKVFKFMAIAAVAFGLCMNVGCGKEEEGGENGGNGGNDTPVVNPENLPTTLDENFDDGSMPASWVTIDADGDSYAWTIASTQFNSVPSWAPNGTDCAISASYINGIGERNPDNYLVTEKIYIESGKKLSYKVSGSHDTDFAEKYSVLIGTLDGNTFTPTATITTETLSQMDVQNREFSLEEWAGQSVYIAFRHFDCTNMYWLCIDDVKVQ